MGGEGKLRRGNKRTVQNTASHLYSPGMEQPLTPCTPAAVHPSVHNLLERFIVCIFFAYQPQLSVIAVSVLRCWLAASTLTDATTTCWWGWICILKWSEFVNLLYYEIRVDGLCCCCFGDLLLLLVCAKIPGFLAARDGRETVGRSARTCLHT